MNIWLYLNYQYTYPACQSINQLSMTIVAMSVTRFTFIQVSEQHFQMDRD